MNIRPYFVVALVLILAACGKSDPVPLPADKQNLLGVWLAKQSEFNNGVSSDNMMLVFHKNNHVSYLRCINRLNGHSYFSLPDAKLVSISDTGFEIAQGILITDLNKKFSITKLPFQKNGNWYFIINKITLRKLKPGERSGHELWKCNEDNTNKTDTTVQF